MRQIDDQPEIEAESANQTETETELKIEQVNLDSVPIKRPDLEKPYVIRNFFKEIRRVSWPTKGKHFRYLFWMFLFLIFLIAFFALVSLGAIEILKMMGAR